VQFESEPAGGFVPEREVISCKYCSDVFTAAMAGRVIRIERGSKMLLHPTVVHVCGTAEDLQAGAERLRGLNQEVIDIVAARTGQQKETVAGRTLASMQRLSGNDAE